MPEAVPPGPEPTRSGVAATLVGAALLVLVGVSGARDLGIGIDQWDELGPVGPSDPLPPFRATLDDGTILTPDSLVGQVSILTFWATWCHACGLEMPILAAIEDRYAGTDLHIYGVNRDSGETTERKAAVEAYLIERELEFPQIYDNGPLARAFKVEAIPHMVIVDKHGAIRHVHMGRVGERTLRRQIDALLDE